MTFPRFSGTWTCAINIRFLLISRIQFARHLGFRELERFVRVVTWVSKRSLGTHLLDCCFWRDWVSFVLLDYEWWIGWNAVRESFPDFWANEQQYAWGGGSDFCNGILARIYPLAFDTFHPFITIFIRSFQQFSYECKTWAARWLYWATDKQKPKCHDGAQTNLGADSRGFAQAIWVNLLTSLFRVQHM